MSIWTIKMINFLYFLPIGTFPSHKNNGQLSCSSFLSTVLMMIYYVIEVEGVAMQFTNSHVDIFLSHICETEIRFVLDFIVKDEIKDICKY